jgi:hypothetical protein
MDHRKDNIVGYRNGTQRFWSFGQSKAQKLRSILPLFCLETEFSNDIGRQNSVTSKLLSE